MAVELSKKIDIPEITTRLTLHAERLLELGKISDTIELFRKAGCYKDAANLLFQVKELFDCSLETSFSLIIIIFKKSAIGAVR